MRVGIVTQGTDGDVLPFVFIARRLEERGHEVLLCCPRSSAILVRKYGMEARSLTFNAQEVVACDKMQRAMQGGDGNVCIYAFIQAIQDQLSRGIDSAEEARGFLAARRPDVLLGHPSLLAFATLAESLGVPVVNVVFSPFLPSRVAYPAFRTSTQLAGAGLLGAPLEAHRRLWQGAVGEAELAEVDGLRRRWQLPPHGSVAALQASLQAMPVANCWSPILEPPPSDLTAEFPLARHAGQVLVEPPPGYSPPPALQAFVEAPGQERPLYVGFGSLSAGSPREATEKVIRALLAAGGRRCVMAGGWSGIGPEHLDPALTEGYAELRRFADASVFGVDSAPHGWLLPRCAGVLHHGGAGTTAAAARAGVPMAIAPFAWDQPWWAERVERLGVGVVVPAMVTEVDAKVLGAILARLVDDAGLARRAADLGARLRGERDGAECVAEVAEAALTTPCAWPTAARPAPSPPPPLLWERPAAAAAPPRVSGGSEPGARRPAGEEGTPAEEAGVCEAGSRA